MLMKLAEYPNLETSAQCTVEIIRDPAGLDALEVQWKELYQTSPTASTPLRFEWVRQWWSIFGSIYGDGGRGMRIITVRRGGRLIGLLPLYESFSGVAGLGIRRLMFITCGAAEFEETCAEYLDLLHAPGEQDPCIESIADALLNSPELRWDELEFRDITSESPLTKLLQLLGGGDHVARREPRLPCHISNLQGGMENFYMTLSPGTRKKTRKMRKDLAASGIKFEIASNPEQVGEFFDQMVGLHRKRWNAEGKTGSFAPRHAAFHRAVSLQLAPAGNVILARLADDNGPIAVTYGHRVGGKFDSYQIGVDREHPALQSPGSALHIELMAYLADNGVVLYDHLPGPNRFKQDYGRENRELILMHFTRPTFRLSTYRAMDKARRGVKKIARMLTEKKPAPEAPKKEPAPVEQ